jgi:hypothetical protein
MLGTNLDDAHSCAIRNLTRKLEAGELLQLQRHEDSSVRFKRTSKPKHETCGSMEFTIYAITLKISVASSSLKMDRVWAAALW